MQEAKAFCRKGFMAGKGLNFRPGDEILSDKCDELHRTLGDEACRKLVDDGYIEIVGPEMPPVPPVDLDPPADVPLTAEQEAEAEAMKAESDAYKQAQLAAEPAPAQEAPAEAASSEEALKQEASEQAEASEPKAEPAPTKGKGKKAR